MNSDIRALQRISKLTSLAEIFDKVDAVAHPVKPREIELKMAFGRVVAADIIAPSSLPKQATALRDGWAVQAELIADAGPYAPLPLTPQPPWIEVGEPLPAGTDAVLAPDALTTNGAKAEAHAPVTTGDGVLPASGDIKAGGLLRKSGEHLRTADLAILQFVGIKKVLVREPKISVLRANPKISEAEDTISSFVARTIETLGGRAEIDSKISLEAAFEDKNTDAVIVIGGSGAGRNDKSVLTLARMGRVEIHGMGIQPGETAALGAVGARPVLIVPGRFDAALSILLIVGRRLFARLSGWAEEDSNIPIKLARKIASQVGIAEFVPVQRTNEGAIPLASEQLPLTALARADGWILVPAESEGYIAGRLIEMRPLP